MIDRNQYQRKDWQQLFEKTFAVKFDLKLKNQSNYRIELFDIIDFTQSKARLSFEFTVNDSKNPINGLMFINRYNIPIGTKNLKIQITTKCNKQLNIYPEFNKCYLEDNHEAWTYKITKIS